jgi:predicted nucleic acid-binding protein
MSTTLDRLVIVNTSPLLYLHQIGHLDLLRCLYTAITIPTAVQQELEIGKAQGVDVPNVQAVEWIRIRAVTLSIPLPSEIDLGLGEAEVIALGFSSDNSLLILDDQLGRQIAALYQLKYTGTLGVLIKAKQAGYLPAISEAIVSLQSQGMWLSDTIIQKVLRLAGE